MNRASRDLIEQAVFTSAVTSRAAGYQVVARSPGIGEEDARELAVWCPSHDALLDSSPSGQSVNFHPLPSGAFCISRTVAAGWEYSGRGGVRVYTQGLVAPPALLARFANNPFALLKAALAGGFLRQYDEVPEILDPFRLSGRATGVEATLLDELTTQLGPAWMAALVEAALGSHTLAVVGGPPPEHLFRGLLACLPLACRTEFSFSTGLRFSSRRPFRLVALGPDAEELRRIQRLYQVTVLDLRGTPPAETPRDSWARLVERAFRARASQRLAQELAERHHDVALEDLPALGLELLEEWDDSFCVALDSESVLEAPASEAPPAPATPLAIPEGFPDRKLPDRLQQAHAAHSRFEKTAAATATTPVTVAVPSERLAGGDPALHQQLQALEMLLSEAVLGHEAAAAQLKTLWPQFKTAWPASLLAQVREEYLRYCLAIWEAQQGSEGTRSPQRALLALEILGVLFDAVP